MHRTHQNEEVAKNTFKIFGRLRAIDEKRMRFLLEPPDGEIISGAIGLDLIDTLWQVPSDVEATIEESIEINPLTGMDRMSYVLADVTVVRQDADIE